VSDTCGNKLQTTSALAKAGVPQPRCLVAYSPESALQAIEAGLPVVLKPPSFVGPPGEQDQRP
jgi:[lysine-biosynthesis-protein LysW]--L-2-aminoadipate ligase